MPAAGTGLALSSSMAHQYIRNVWIPTLLLLPAAAFAQSPQSPQDSQAFAERFVTAQLTTAGSQQTVFASADALDPRLKLPQCTGQTMGMMPAAGRIATRITVGVKC